MPNISKQYLNFLGGEVSPRLHHRADLEQFGRWFAEAKNLRFYETGSFYNRAGFQRVATTKSDSPSSTVKLLSFSFNDEQSFLVELGTYNGTGYARFFKDGNPIMNGALPYEIVSPFSNLDGQQIKYAQAGDILFLTNATYGIWELRRLKYDGSEWEFKKFTGPTMPLGDLNDHQDYTLSATNTQLSVTGLKIVSIPSDYPTIFNGATLYFDNVEVYTSSAYFSIPSLVTALNTALTAASYTITVSNTGNTIEFRSDDFDGQGATNIRLEIGEDVTSTETFTETREGEFEFPIEDYYRVKSLTVDDSSIFNIFQARNISFWGRIAGVRSYVVIHQDETVTCSVDQDVNALTKVEAARNLANSFLTGWGNRTYSDNDIRNVQMANAGVELWNNEYFLAIRPIPQAKAWSTSADVEATQVQGEYFTLRGARILPDTSGKTIEIRSSNGWSKVDTFATASMTVTLEYYTQKKIIVDAQNMDAEDGYRIDAAPGANTFFSNMSIGDTFGVRIAKDAESISGTWTTPSPGEVVPIISSTAKGLGAYRYYTSGNWEGRIDVRYSTDKGLNWKLLHTISSNDKDAPGNDNTSGDLEGEDIIWFRAEFNITDGEVNFVLETAPYYVWSYYEIKGVSDANTAYAKCIRNDTGEFSYQNEFAKNAFSSQLGYPSCVGFYQNRLFFGKGYMLYGSAISDFWNFYRRGENIQDDDAMDMSLLSYKVNNIQNIVTQKKFFAFTEGAEFSIASEGAITQADKYLQQMSSHGSSNITPVLTGDIIVFIDKSHNTVRALKYSLESDSYEAPDISIYLKQLLEDEEFVDADFAYNQKECFFVTKSGRVFIMKYLPEQNILSWSHWEHGRGAIKELRVVKNGYKDDIYALVAYPDSMTIERLGTDVYLDGYVPLRNQSPTTSLTTVYPQWTDVVVIADDGTYQTGQTDEDGVVELEKEITPIAYGISYQSVATLLTPTIAQQDQTFSTYILNRPFKVHFFYSESYGFKVGAEEDEKMRIIWKNQYTDFNPETSTLTTGHKSVLIPCRFELSNKVSFVQDTPYPMEVTDVLIDTDYGGK